MRNLFPIILCIAANSAVAQDLAPRGDLIRSGSDTLEVFFVRGIDTTRTGTLIDEVSFLESGDRLLLRRVYRSQDNVLGARIDTLTDDGISLRPVSHRSRTSSALEFLEFSTTAVNGWLLLANGDSVAVSVPVEGDFYNASSFDLVLRASPLHDSWKVSVPSFFAGSRSMAELHARVEGTDTLEGRPTWRVQADFGGTPVTFWVDKDSRRLTRQWMQFRPDAGILFARPRITALPRRAT